MREHLRLADEGRRGHLRHHEARVEPCVRAREEGRKLAKTDLANDFPKIEDGVRGMAFIKAVVDALKADQRPVASVPGVGWDEIAKQWEEVIR